MLSVALALGVIRLSTLLANVGAVKEHTWHSEMMDATQDAKGVWWFYAATNSHPALSTPKAQSGS